LASSRSSARQSGRKKKIAIDLALGKPSIERKPSRSDIIETIGDELLVTDSSIDSRLRTHDPSVLAPSSWRAFAPAPPTISA